MVPIGFLPSFLETNLEAAVYSNRMIMKTISMQNNSAGTMSNPPGLLTAAGVWSLRPHRGQVEWLPAPPAPRQRNNARRKEAASQKPGLWVSLPAEPVFEKGLLGLLMLTGTMGIAYGFSCLVDLVQHWALVNASIGQMIK